MAAETSNGAEPALTPNDVKVTYDAVPDVETGIGTVVVNNENDSNPLQVLQEQTQKFHQETLQPLLEKAGDSFRDSVRQAQVFGSERLWEAKEHSGRWIAEAGTHLETARVATVNKTKELTDVTVAKTKEITEATVAKTKELTDVTVAKTKELTDVTVAKTKELTAATVAHSQVLGAATAEKTRRFTDFTVTQSRALGAATVEGTRSLSMGTQAATAVAIAQTQHTFSQVGSNPLEYDEEGKPVVKGSQNDFLVQGMMSHVVQTTAVLGFAAAFVAMILIDQQLLDISAFCTIVLAPLVFWQKIQLKKLGGMRGQQNALRASVNRLTVENGKLSEANTQLEGQVESLQGVESKLNDVAIQSGTQVERLVGIVQQNGEIQKTIMRQLEDQIVQQLLTAILATDRDGNFTLDKREVYQLEMRLEAIPAVHFEKEKFRDFLASDEDDLTLADLTKLVHNIKDASVPDDQRIFHFEPKDILEEVPAPESA